VFPVYLCPQTRDALAFGGALMKRFVRCSTLITVLTACGTGTVRGQTPGTTGPDRGYAELTVGATLGHKSASSIGGEAGYTVTETWQVFLEAGRMGNVATADADARALIIGNAIGATGTSVAQRAAYFDVGARYRLHEYGRWRPYALLGIGAAGVKTTTDFIVGGTDVTGQLDQYGAQLGNDLSGTVAKAFLTVGAGASAGFGKRYLVDLSYRYGRLFPRTSRIANDSGINTQRLQAGIGIRF
jgi:opacity protein-like surface antigen